MVSNSDIFHKLHQIALKLKNNHKSHSVNEPLNIAIAMFTNFLKGQ